MIRVEHELHQRRRSRNLGLLAVLVAFAALVFGLTIVKVTQGGMLEAFDHQPRATLLPLDPNPPARNAAPVAAPGTPAALVDGVQTAPPRSGNNTQGQVP